MMLVVVLLIGGFLHRPVARHGQSIRPDHRVEVGAWNILEMIFRKQLAVDLDPQPVVELGDPGALFGPAQSARTLAASEGEEEKKNRRSGQILPGHCTECY